MNVNGVRFKAVTKNIKQKHLFPETMSPFLRINHITHGQLFSRGLFIKQKVVPRKSVDCEVCGLSRETSRHFVFQEKHISVLN